MRGVAKMIDGQERRKGIIERLSHENKPLSGMALGKQFGISRQVVVQDIALLRAEGFDVLATARGYILNQDVAFMKNRVVMVKHKADELEDELNTIVDNGGRIRNVIIQHSLYGELTGDLMLKTRREIKAFVEKVGKTQSEPLLRLTDGVHMHTLEATTEEELDIIEEELEAKGYLIR